MDANIAIEKICPRCQQAFACRQRDITKCDCRKIKLDIGDLQKLQPYNYCLCLECLLAISSSATGK